MKPGVYLSFESVDDLYVRLSLVVAEWMLCPSCRAPIVHSTRHFRHMVTPRLDEGRVEIVGDRPDDRLLCECGYDGRAALHTKW